MTESDGGKVTEEPQEERGDPGSRNKDSTSGTDRPAGTSDADDYTGIDPQEPITDSPTLPAGGG